jgi:hypothetical protein
MALTKIISGGQTGVDRGALDAALVAGFTCGGWCPADRGAEDGEIYSAFHASPLALLGAAPTGVRRRFASSSERVATGPWQRTLRRSAESP